MMKDPWASPFRFLYIGPSFVSSKSRSLSLFLSCVSRFLREHLENPERVWHRTRKDEKSEREKADGGRGKQRGKRGNTCNAPVYASLIKRLRLVIRAGGKLAEP